MKKRKGPEFLCSQDVAKKLRNLPFQREKFNFFNTAALYAPDFPYPEDDDYHERFNWVHHEWHYGRQHPLAHFPMLPHLIAQARSKPDELFVLTNRAMPLTGEGEAYDFDRRAVACLLGSDFAEFLLNKGVVNSSAVIWFNDVAIDDTPTTYGFSNRFDKAQKLPSFSASRKYQTCLPIYSYPFMSAPMSDAEYDKFEEIECVLPLREDYSHDEGGGTNRPGQPTGPVRPCAAPRISNTTIQSPWVES